jgi:Mrp family chromosome partitioning ATPase
MQQLLAFAEASYDLVILDAPVILGFADGLQLASLCQGVVMVSRLDKITQADLTQAVTILGQANAIGIVANGYRGGTKQDKGYHRNGHIPTPAGSRPNILNMARSRLPKRLPNHSSRPTSEPTLKPTSKPTPPLPSQS